MSNTNINITQIVNHIIIEPAKRHPVIAFITILGICIGIVTGSVTLYDRFVNAIYSNKIYLSLWETGKKVPITEIVSTIPPITPIKINEPTALRFVLTQDNTNSPQISTIFLTFPNDAKITPIPDNGWSWVRNNDVANTYFLNFTTLQVLARGSDCNLPALNVVFEKVGQLPFSYKIVGNKINPIERHFSIDTTRTYDEWLENGYTFLTHATFDPPVSYNTASAPTVITRPINLPTVTPDANVSTVQKENNTSQDINY